MRFWYATANELDRGIAMDIIESAYSRYCTERFPSPNEKQVTRIEKRMGVALPPEYRRYLLVFNGGYFNEPHIVSDRVPLDRLTVMYGIGASHSSGELASTASLALFTGNYPVQVLPIGYTLMGNLLLLNTHPDDYECGAVLFKKASAGTCFLAKGIVEFFTLLHEPLYD